MTSYLSLRSNGINPAMNTFTSTLRMSTADSTRKVVLSDPTAGDANRFYGMGVSSNVMNFNVSSSTGAFAFYAGSTVSTATEVMRVTGTGLVGIGTTAPAGQLGLYGISTPISMAIANSNTNGVAVLGLASAVENFAGGSAAGDVILRNSDATKKLHLLSGAGTAVMTVTSSMVGIGTTVPSAKLTVYGITNMYLNTNTFTFDPTSFGNMYHYSPTSAADINPVLRACYGTYFPTRDSTWINQGAVIQFYDENTNSSYPTSIRGGAIAFATINVSGQNNTTAPTERMRITPAGNVGINTTAPGYNLHVNGSSKFGGAGGYIYVTGESGFPAENCVTLFGNPGASYSSVHIRTDHSAVSDRYIFLVSGGGAGSAFSIRADGYTYASWFAAGSKSFDIQHPLYPTDNTKHLVHNCIEGPRSDLLYRGSKALSNGVAVINIDKECTHHMANSMSEGTFDALCRNPIVMLQNNETFDRVIGKIQNGILTITSENTSSNAIIDWVVIAERKDPTILQNKFTDQNGYLVTEYTTPTADSSGI